MATSSHYRLGSIWFVTFATSVGTAIQEYSPWQLGPEQMQYVQRILTTYPELQSIE